MKVAEDRHLPRVDEVPPNLALLILGKALAEAYGDTADHPLPEPLARILREIEDREGTPHLSPKAVRRHRHAREFTGQGSAMRCAVRKLVGAAGDR